jgi:DNA-binding Xre family transcriptional regulator
MVAAQRDIWRPTQLLVAFREVGFTPSLSKVAALWSGKPVTVRMEDLDKICAALDCTVADLMVAEPQQHLAQREQPQQRAVGEQREGGPVRPAAACRRTEAEGPMVISECVRCHGWGPVRPLGSCQTCLNWAPRGGYKGRCHRCRHEGKVNRDGLCRLCMLEIRMVPDHEWADAAARRTLGPVRDLQLPLLLLEGVRLPVVLARHHDRPLVRERLRTERSAGPWTWAKKGDDLQVCPPQVTGQLPLLPRLPRTFTRQHGYRIAARDFPEWADVLQAVERVRVRRDLSAGWSESVVQMMRLALASREASEQLVDEYVVAELPRMRPAVAEVLREAGLLRRRLGSGLAQNGYRRERRRMVSCEHCLAWSGDARPLCDSCREWARQSDRESGPCLRCGRTWPLKDGQCRFCHLVLNEHVGDGPAVEQLWFGANLGHGLYTKQPGDYSQGSRKSRRRELERREKQTRQADRRLSPHLIDPHQLELFPPPARVWKRAQYIQLPTMTPEAEQLVADFWQFTADQHWTSPSRDINVKVLRLLVAWLGIDAPSSRPTSAPSPDSARTGQDVASQPSSTSAACSFPWSGRIRIRSRSNGSCRVFPITCGTRRTPGSACSAEKAASPPSR